MQRAVAAVLVLALGSGLSASTHRLPVMSGPIGDRLYRTTLELRATVPDQCRLEIRTVDGQKFEAAQSLDAARSIVLPDFGRELRVSSALTVICAGEVSAVSRIQESTDGGVTYSQGLLFSTPARDSLVAGETAMLPVEGALSLAETSGQAVQVRARYRSTRLNATNERQYNLGPHQQRLIDFSSELGSIEATISVSGGEGTVLLSTQATAPELADRAMPPPARPPPSRAVARSPVHNIVVSSFQAAPFHEKGTGLIYFRDRWYDPKTGSFLSPDPLGVAGGSANLYSFAQSDPVNRRDPTGNRSELSDDRRAIAAKREAEAAAAWRASDVAEKLRLDALHRAGTRRMIELRALGVDVRAEDIVYLTANGLYGLTASGRVIRNPAAGVIEDATTDLVLTVTAFKVAAPAISTAFRAGGVRAAAPIVADELAGVALGVNPSLIVNAPRAIANAFQAQMALADLTRAVSAELAANPELARGVLSRAEYEAAVNSSRIAAAQYGNAVERLVARRIEKDRALREVFEYVGGPNNPDFTAFGRNFDITTETEAQVMRHMQRTGYGNELIVVTYQRPPTFTTFPRSQ